MFQKIKIAKIFFVATLFVSSVSLAMNSPYNRDPNGLFNFKSNSWDDNHREYMLDNQCEESTMNLPKIQAAIDYGKSYRLRKGISAIVLGSPLVAIGFWAYKNPAEALAINFAYSFIPTLIYLERCYAFTESASKIYNTQKKLNNMYIVKDKLQLKSLNYY